LRRLVADEQTDDEETARRRRLLKDRRQRLRDLYELGDLAKAEYVSKRDAIDAELDSLSPGVSPDVERARAVLEDFGRFWDEEADPDKRRELVAQLVDRVWIDDKRVVAIRPTPAFSRFSPATAPETRIPPPLVRQGVGKAGATGLESGLYTSGDRGPNRANQAVSACSRRWRRQIYLLRAAGQTGRFNGRR
jgi:hypothetical protein